MKKFLVIYKAPSEEFQKLMANSTPEEQKKGMEDWGKWMKEHSAELVDGGAPVGKTKQVTMDSVTDIKNDIGGYSIVQAESHDDAAKIFTDSPHFSVPRSSIEVMEIMPMLTN
ncbi:MAG: YciI family protein [bacterium]|nr:YciI family protein [bacterium]